MVAMVERRSDQATESDLTGLWRAMPMSLELKRTGADADLDDSAWTSVVVPGHWGQVPELASHDGPILHRKRFTHMPPVADERRWLRFDGVLSGAEIWLDGSYIGDTTSYFAPHRFDVTDQLRLDEEHLLAVEVSCPSQGASTAKSSLTGSLQTGHLAPSGNPGGIWQPVAIDTTGPVAIRHSRLLCTKANSDRAELHIRLVLDAVDQTDIRIDTSLVGPDGVSAGGGVERHSLASGENRIEWTVEIAAPHLWWPAVLGEQPLYEVAVAVRLGDGELSDRQDWRTGLRRISVDNFIWRVNGQRLFAKGIAAGPTGRFLNDTSAEVLREDVGRVRDAGLDLIRLYGHVGRPEIYEEADRLGVLIWQDLPMVGGYSSKVRSAARSMARAAVDHLGHHPSVGLWCGHSEPNGQIMTAPVHHHDQRPEIGAHQTLEDLTIEDASDRPAEPEPTPVIGIGRRFGRHLLPSWNRSILDPVIARELGNADQSRPIIARSGSLPSLADPAGSDTHLWLGWHTGRPDDLPGLLRRWPRLATFMGGIGAQSVTSAPWDEDEPRWPAAEQGAFARYVPRQAYPDGESWAAASQAYQADIVRVHIETLRRLKYHPAGGFCIESLADAEPEGGFGVLGLDRRPKPAHNVLIDACRPVVVIADLPPAIVVPNQDVSLAVHVVSDLRKPLGEVRVTGHAHDEHRGSDGTPGWSTQVVWEGDIPPDSCTKVGDFTFTAPDQTGPIVIDFELESAELLATNRYRTVVIPTSEAIGPPKR
jgi:beta-mannosidase